LKRNIKCPRTDYRAAISVKNKKKKQQIGRPIEGRIRIASRSQRGAHCSAPEIPNASKSNPVFPRRRGRAKTYPQEMIMVDTQQIPTQLPTQIRELAEKNFEQAREAFLGVIGAAQKATGSAEALPSGAKEAVTKAISFAETNVNAAFDLAQKLLHAKDVQEVFALQTEFAKNQLAAIQTHAKEFADSAQSAFTAATKK
jgi:phasin